MSCVNYGSIKKEKVGIEKRKTLKENFHRKMQLYK